MRRLHIAWVMPLLLGGCAAGSPTAGLPDADSAAVATYVQYCGGCHALPHPGRHGRQEWLAMVGIMEQRMLERGMEPPGEADRQTIIDYLQVHAR